MLLVCVAAILGPFVSVISTSLASESQVRAAGGYVLWPKEPTLAAYRAVLGGGVVSHAVLVSIVITVVGSILSLTATTMLAYALSRPGSYGHRPFVLMILFTLLFSPGIIPSYLVVKSLGLIDSYWSLILPVMISGFNVVVVRAFFLELPSELIDAARIDGASEPRILLSIVMPLSRAVVAVIGLFYAVSYWNSFFTALLYLNDSSKWPLSLVLRTYVVNNTKLSIDERPIGGLVPPATQSLQMATLLLAIIPMLLLVPFVQRHFTKGVILGAVKG